MDTLIDFVVAIVLGAMMAYAVVGGTCITHPQNDTAVCEFFR